MPEEYSLCSFEVYEDTSSFILMFSLGVRLQREKIRIDQEKKKDKSNFQSNFSSAEIVSVHGMLIDALSW